MKRIIFLVCFFIVATSLRKIPTVEIDRAKDDKFCGIMSFSAANNMSVEDPLCVIQFIGVTFNPGAQYFPNYSPGQSGQLGEINAPGSAGQYFTLKILLTAYSNQVRLYRGGTLYHTVWNPPSEGGFVFFYNVPAGCATFDIVVE